MTGHELFERVFWVTLLLALMAAIGVILVTLYQWDSTLLGPCLEEDSTHCYWDAETQGNGVGHDVVTP